MPTLKKILVPIDFSEGSKAALEEAIFLAQPFGATIDLVHAWQMPIYVGADMMLLGPGEMRATFQEFTERMAEKDLEAWRVALVKRGFSKAAGFLVLGDPAQSILETAKGYDMLVMGTHGRTGIVHALMGSVAEKVLRRAICPVLTVRAPPEAAKVASAPQPKVSSTSAPAPAEIS
jgi:universal stress protein A